MDHESTSIDDLVQLLEHTTEKLRTTEDWLEITTQRIRTLFESIPFGLFITSESGKIEAVNPTGLTMFACRDTDMFGHPMAEFFQDSDGQDLFAVSSSGDRPKIAHALRADGKQFPAEVLCRSFSTPSAPQLLVIIEDVTPKFEMERMKQEFVSMVSHDLRTPLTSIQCFLNTICDGTYDESSAVLKEKSRAIEKDATRLITMINSLLDIDKMEAGRFEMFIDLIVVADIVDGSLQSVSSFAEERGVKLNADIPSREIYVEADSDLAVQVLVNFLSNAIKFSPSGESVRVSTEADQAFVKMLVTDRGPGIPEKFRKRMFNRFEQAEISDARVKGGSGLGLSIAKNIIEQHGGAIGVESQEGRGSTFWFTLPRGSI